MLSPRRKVARMRTIIGSELHALKKDRRLIDKWEGRYFKVHKTQARSHLKRELDEQIKLLKGILKQWEKECKESWK